MRSILGSLINPKTGLSKDTLFEINWDDVASFLTEALSAEENENKTEMGVMAQGISKAAEILSAQYHLICTNVPYLTRSKQEMKRLELL